MAGEYWVVQVEADSGVLEEADLGVLEEGYWEVPEGVDSPGLVEVNTADFEEEEVDSRGLVEAGWKEGHWEDPEEVDLAGLEEADWEIL